MSTVETKQRERMSRKFSSDKPTPLDFDMFVPWICKQWQVPTIVEVMRTYLDMLMFYIRRYIKRLNLHLY